ncbi:MAG: antibiotic biosynthesis monooxygenase [Inquilinus sp.]|nr:antibiotic biosynthesis monooxygenase [Inquilinus sp.]
MAAEDNKAEPAGEGELDRFAIIVRIDLVPGNRPRFAELIGENARSSVRDEPGCRRFDVLAPREGGDRVVLYEVYDDRTAFEAHLQTPHFAAFRDAATAIIAGQTIEEFDLADNAAG